MSLKPSLSALLAALLLALAQPATAQNAAEDAPRPYPDRHLEMQDERLRLTEPQLPGSYPTPLHLRHKQTHWIRIENRPDGPIAVFDHEGSGQVVGKVLAPVAQVNPKGFTASGWGQPGAITATSVNAIHVKTAHDYSAGKGVIFSLTPVEFADFDPASYQSYFNQSSSMFTDIPAGREIFGGRWAPLVGSEIFVRTATPAQTASQRPPLRDGEPDGLRWGLSDIKPGARPVQRPVDAPDGTGSIAPMPDGYIPAAGDVLYIRVERLKYNPEYLEFENRFGGLIWVKELGLAPYPIGQVLKPVVGVGRFLGTQYADVGRIRANHPGVIDISTTDEGVTGGFQILPRDHSMSPEMLSARVKTQWMVIGPLWALDPSWEGLPPLFADYLYPAWTPTDSEIVSGADVFLSRFTVRARYGDADDPAEYELLRPARGLDNQALRHLTHLRIYFPRDSKL